MSDYKAPLEDMKFVLYEVLEADKLFASMPGTAEVSNDLINAILEESARISESLLAPLNRSGDEEGCTFADGAVTTPKGFPEAYRTFAEGGWVGLSGDVEYGGQGMPKMLSVLFEEMVMAANCSFALYPILSTGATLALARHASDEMKKTYLSKLYQGTWSATMCLTEAHAGTDLGIINTKAVAHDSGDGSYLVSGTKIFITGGEHDLSDNIIHMVLAKLPDAPPGPRGISLFLVPKFMVDADGNPGQRNAVHCGSIEHKMGIKGSATCVMNFDGARGYLVGELNKGLNYMFTMMNYERLSIGLQGLGLSEASYQTARDYANERVQGRAAAGPVNPDRSADPIMVHPDVRRMLLTMRANTEAGRAVASFVASQLDIAHFHEDEEQKIRARKMVALLTPIAKAAFTDRGFEACVLGQQVLGGHGYIREWGQEQKVRDARIAQIYEGTNGIQALDLVGRKVVRDREELLDVLVTEIRGFIAANEGHAQEAGPLQEFILSLDEALTCLCETTEQVKQRAATDANAIGAASTPYLELMTLVLYAYMWSRMVRVALTRVEHDDPTGFYDAKIKTGRFFISRLLPRYQALAEEIGAGSEVVMSMGAEQF